MGCKYSKLFISDYHFHVESSSLVIFGFCEVATGRFLWVVLPWQSVSVA